MQRLTRTTQLVLLGGIFSALIALLMYFTTDDGTFSHNPVVAIIWGGILGYMGAINLFRYIDGREDE